MYNYWGNSLVHQTRYDRSISQRKDDFLIVYYLFWFRDNVLPLFLDILLYVRLCYSTHTLLSVPPTLSFFPSLYLFLSLSLLPSICHSLTVPVCLSVCGSLAFTVSVCQCICLSLSLSLHLSPISVFLFKKNVNISIVFTIVVKTVVMLKSVQHHIMLKS